MHIVDEVFDLFAKRGSAAYLGEPVSQQEHALQAAHLAFLEDAPGTLVAAALLHDIGHLLGTEDDAAERGIDARHEERGHAWLSRWFVPQVVEPVRLHVIAKRYLCAVKPEYLQSLSTASQRSLELQGGPLPPDEAYLFERNPFGAAAVRVRLWDDCAKVPACEVPGIEHYAAILRGALKA
jgi:gamma-butyrobetaine dioxygenase